MAVEILLTRSLTGLLPADDDAREKLKAWKLGQPMKCEVRIARDSSRMRYYWGLVDIILQNIDQTFASKEEVSESVVVCLLHNAEKTRSSKTALSFSMSAR